MSSHLTETLQSLCVTSIACNFDKLFASFFSSKSENFALYLEFIQKLYCDQILEKLCSKNLLKNEHLKCIINKYTREIDLRYLLNCDLCAIEERLEDIGNVITKFSMAGVKFFNVDSFLGYLSKVHSLELMNTNCSDRSLVIIAENCTELKHLDVFGCHRVTDSGLMCLCQKSLPLESLNIEETSVTYRGVASILKNIPSLTKLYFDNVPRAVFEAAGLNDALGNVDSIIFNLSNIVIFNNPMRPETHLTAVLNTCKSFCPFIKDLVVTEIVSEQQLYLCSLFENLELVNLQCSLVVTPKLCANNFLQACGDKITNLTLKSFSLSVEILASSCPNLESLTLDYPSFQELKTTSFSFPCLRILSLQNADLTESQLSVTSVISSSPQLEKLNIVYSLFSEKMCDVILNYPKKLVSLNFSNTMVAASFIKEILKVHNGLVKLVIDNSGISTEEFDDLMDIVDDMELKVDIVWADYSQAIRELYYADYDSIFHDIRRHILKL